MRQIEQDRAGGRSDELDGKRYFFGGSRLIAGQLARSGDRGSPKVRDAHFGQRQCDAQIEVIRPHGSLEQVLGLTHAIADRVLVNAEALGRSSVARALVEEGAQGLHQAERGLVARRERAERATHEVAGLAEIRRGERSQGDARVTNYGPGRAFAEDRHPPWANAGLFARGEPLPASKRRRKSRSWPERSTYATITLRPSGAWVCFATSPSGDSLNGGSTFGRGETGCEPASAHRPYP